MRSVRWTEVAAATLLAVSARAVWAQDPLTAAPPADLATPAGGPVAADAAEPAPAADVALPTKPPFPGEGPIFDRYRDIAKDLRCPTCTGLSVLESDAKFSEQIKSIVQEQVIAGKSKDEIFQYFVERYGPWILRAPPKSGFNTVAWAFPIAILVGGPPLIYVFVWRRKKQVSTYGVRGIEVVVAEMHAELAKLRTARGGRA